MPTMGPGGPYDGRAMSETSDTTGWIVDVDARNFEKEVIERSLSMPVVVDFWAEWCEPCKTLGPLLEKRATDGAGRFLLAKVDIDRNPQLAQAFRVQGIPAVLAVAKGQLVDGFEGALPEPEIDAFLDRIAPGQGGARASGVLAEARALADAGDGDGAVELLRGHLRAQTDDSAARSLLVELLVEAGKLDDARRVFDKLPAEARDSDSGKALAARLSLAKDAGDVGELRAAVEAAPGDAAARLALGRAHVAAQAYEEGLEQLLEAIRLDPQGSGAEARAAMLEVFDVLGLEDPVANDYRFKLSLELFA
jgi:putative thioredoxin